MVLELDFNADGIQVGRTELVSVVPEPNSFLLTVVGSLALLIFRKNPACLHRRLGGALWKKTHR
jgi:hypothetical protein